MGNTVGSIFSGLGQLIGKILGHPLDFLSGKSCDSTCGSTWDIICYIENFCVSHLLKLVMVATLFYLVLLFFYLLFSLGICQCICHTLFRIVWAFFSTYFSAFHFCCSYLCHKLRTVKRKPRRRRRMRRRDMEEFGAYSSGSSSTSEDDYELAERCSLQQPRNVEHGRSQLSCRRDYKNEHLRRSLRPNTYRTNVELSRIGHLRRKEILNDIGDHSNPIHHHLCVTRSSKFSRKGSRRRNGISRGRR